MLVLLLRRTVKFKDVFQIGEAKDQVFQYLVHEALEKLVCVPQAGGYERKFDESKTGGFAVI